MTFREWLERKTVGTKEQREARKRKRQEYRQAYEEAYHRGRVKEAKERGFKAGKANKTKSWSERMGGVSDVMESVLGSDLVSGEKKPRVKGRKHRRRVKAKPKRIEYY